ncbi:response regulator transcription factor [Streptococcus cristatus]|uniref:Response regulator transcription factor n=1 Tax=Streptococcus cristatus TaxID=45634 RepID=A0A5B0DC61_STRCR|nr:response regulator transcription factor [Streptococcus cristatus]KAA0964514.1 response regulator transcription factor [Streptococcus cristatus]
MAKLLLIEDNNDIHEILKNLFTQEHVVFSAYSGTEGLRIFAEEEIHLVLLDIMLPGKNGDEVLREIRKTSQVPVVMLTALGEKSLVSQYLLDGANDYIVKPFNLDEVAARVTVQLRGSQQAQSKPAGETLIKNIRLLPDTFEIASGDQSMRLGKKEFQIFQTLLAHPKKIFTKEELYELVWEETYLPGDNTLNAHLSNLRKKLAQLDSSTDYIETIWGLGVRLKED